MTAGAAAIVDGLRRRRAESRSRRADHQKATRRPLPARAPPMGLAHVAVAIEHATSRPSGPIGQTGRIVCVQWTWLLALGIFRAMKRLILLAAVLWLGASTVALVATARKARETSSWSSPA